MTNSFFDTPSREPGEVTTAQRFQVERDQYGRRILPDNTGKEVPWTGITTMARTLDDTYNLEKWKLRQAVWGQAHSPHLIALAGAASKTDNKTLDKVATDAMAAASDHKADLGTSLHNILARVDAGLPVHEAPEYFRPMIQLYQAELIRHKIQILPDFIERSVVSNLYHVDGIGDRWVQLPDGTVVYMDIKTGDDPSKYPHKTAIQLAICANADAAIDHATGLQVPMPPVEKSFALVMHLDPTAGTARLLRNDKIPHAWAAVRLAYEVREWRRLDLTFHPYISESNWAPKPTERLYPCGDCGAPDHRATAVHRPGCSQDQSFVRTPLLKPAAPALAANPMPYSTETDHDRPYSSNGHIEAPLPYCSDCDHDTHVCGGCGRPMPHGYSDCGCTASVDPVAVKKDAAVRVDDILAIRKNDKEELKRWVYDLGGRDFQHHRKWLAEWIVEHSPDSVDVERPQGKINSPNLNGGETAPIPSAASANVVAAINAAPSIDELRKIHKRWTAAYGPDSWSGEILAKGHKRMTEIRMSEVSAR